MDEYFVTNYRVVLYRRTQKDGFEKIKTLDIDDSGTSNKLPLITKVFRSAGLNIADVSKVTFEQIPFKGVGKNERR